MSFTGRRSGRCNYPKANSAGYGPIGTLWCLQMLTVACCGRQQEISPTNLLLGGQSELPICSTSTQMEPALPRGFCLTGKTPEGSCRPQRPRRDFKHSASVRRQQTTLEFGLVARRTVSLRRGRRSRKSLSQCAWTLGALQYRQFTLANWSGLIAAEVPLWSTFTCTSA